MFGENIALELKNTRAMSVVSETISDLYMIPGDSLPTSVDGEKRKSGLSEITFATFKDVLPDLQLLGVCLKSRYYK